MNFYLIYIIITDLKKFENIIKYLSAQITSSIIDSLKLSKIFFSENELKSLINTLFLHMIYIIHCIFLKIVQQLERLCFNVFFSKSFN